MFVTLADRLGREFLLQGSPGQRAAHLLHSLHIPTDAVLLSVNDRYVDPVAYLLRELDTVRLEMVRAYHLPDFLAALGLTDEPAIVALRPDEQPGRTVDVDAVYVKRSLRFCDDGDLLLHSDALDEPGVLRFVENGFIEGFEALDVAHELTLVALSGGRDSLAMTYLLAAARDSGVEVRMRAITVETIALPADLPVAVEACRSLGIEHDVFTATEIKALFGLRCSVEEALERILDVLGQGNAIAACHTIMRAAVEEHARRHQIANVAFGLHNEDLLATLLRSLSSGIPFGESMIKKSWGSFEFCYPLWPLTKKELTLYLKLRAPDHARQGAPSRFDRGGLNRDINYFLADSLQSLWPELSLHLFSGYEKALRSMRGVIQSFVQCRRCRLTMVRDLQDTNGGLCTTCADMELLGLSDD